MRNRERISRERSAIGRSISTLCLLLLAAMLPAGAQMRTSAGSPATMATDSRIDRDRAEQVLAAQKPVFIENRGQWDRRAKFLLRSPGLDLWITGNGVVYDLNRVEKQPDRKGARLSSSALPDDEPSEIRVTRAPVFITFEGASQSASAVGSGRRPEYHNYYLGNDRSKWAEHVSLYSDARVQGLYRGIDALFYLDNGRPRYDLVVAPGADPAAIRMNIEGAANVSVGANGNLEIETTLGTVEQRELFAYQEINGRRQKVACGFVIGRNGEVGFSVGRYDRSRPLVIDPIVWATYLGGNGDELDGNMAVDDNGNIYIAGSTASTNFPTLNASQTSNAGSDDAYVTKITSDGTISYSTYLGGGALEQGFGIAVDASGNAYITGQTWSTDFPTLNAFQTSLSGLTDAFITKLTSSGTQSWSTYLGGNSPDYGFGIALDGSANAYISGTTLSTDFPILNASQGTIGGSADAFVAKFTSSGTQSYTTYLGGGAIEEGRRIAIDNGGNAYITGITTSTNFPTLNASQTSNAGNYDAFATKLNASGARVYSTYLGGSGLDWSFGIAIDGDGNAYITGHTRSTDFPTLDALQGSRSGFTDAFLTKLTSGGARSFSTYLGGSSTEAGHGVATDGSGNVYVTGSTQSTDFPTVNAMQTEGGAFIMRLNSSGVSTFSTYHGGSGSVGETIAIDDAGNIILYGYTHSPNLPMPNGAQTSHGGGTYDGFVTKISPLSNVTLNGTSPYCAGTSVTISWEATGVSSVDIDYSTDNGATWSSVVTSQTSGATGGSYNWTVPNSPGSDRQIRVTDAANSSISVVSSAFTISSSPAISTHPVDQDIVAGSTASFSASTGGGESVQWQLSTDGGTNWSDIANATSSSYSFTASITQSGNQYRAVFDNGACTNTTVAATLTVKVSASDLGPAVVFLAVTSNTDNNRDIDIKVELYRNSALISSGELIDEKVTGPGQNSSRKYTVPLAMTNGAVDFGPNDQLHVKVYARRNGGSRDFPALLWYNDNPASSTNHGNKGWCRVGAESEGGNSSDYFYLRSSSALSTSAGSSGASIEKTLGTSWELFGTWSMYGSQMKPATGSTATGTLSAVVVPNPINSGGALLGLYSPAGGDVVVMVSDPMGRVVLQLPTVSVERSGEMQLPLDISSLRSGIYMVRVTAGEATTITPITVVR